MTRPAVPMPALQYDDNHAEGREECHDDGTTNTDDVDDGNGYVRPPATSTATAFWDTICESMVASNEGNYGRLLHVV